MLCNLIAGCLVSAARRAWPSLAPHSCGEWLLPEPLQRFWTALDPYLDTRWGADYVAGDAGHERPAVSPADSQLAEALQGLL